MLEDRSTNSSSRELVFPNDDPDVFADFISWAYCGQIRRTELSDHPSRLFHLFQLWALAERFLVPGLQDLAMTNCSQFLDNSPDQLVGCDAVNHAYLHTGGGSALRQLAVNIWAKRATKAEILQVQRVFHRQFLEDLSLAWLDERERAKPDVCLSLHLPNNILFYFFLFYLFFFNLYCLLIEPTSPSRYFHHPKVISCSIRLPPRRPSDARSQKHDRPRQKLKWRTEESKHPLPDGIHLNPDRLLPRSRPPRNPTNVSPDLPHLSNPTFVLGSLAMK